MSLRTKFASTRRAFSFKRGRNYFILKRTFLAAKAGSVSVKKSMPLALSFEPTTQCNLRCPECPSGLREFTRPTGSASYELFTNIIDQAASHLVWLTLYFQGEPLINARFFDMVKYAKKSGISVATSTNGHLLTESAAEKMIESEIDQVIISVDGVDQNSYEHYRKGGNLKQVLAGIERLVAAKRASKKEHTAIILQFLVFRSNEHQIEQIKALGKKLGVDEVQLKTAQFYDFENGHPEIPTIDKWSRYREVAPNQWTIKNPMKNSCWRAWHSAVITWDGLVVPCCFDKDADHRLGDLKTESLKEIWQGEQRLNFLKRVFKDRASVAICRNCTEGTN